MRGLDLKIHLLKEELAKTYIDSRKAEIRREIGVIQEQLNAEKKAMEERQEELQFSSGEYEELTKEKDPDGELWDELRGERMVGW